MSDLFNGTLHFVQVTFSSTDKYPQQKRRSSVKSGHGYGRLATRSERLSPFRCTPLNMATTAFVSVQMFVTHNSKCPAAPSTTMMFKRSSDDTFAKLAGTMPVSSCDFHPTSTILPIAEARGWRLPRLCRLPLHQLVYQQRPAGHDETYGSGCHVPLGRGPATKSRKWWSTQKSTGVPKFAIRAARTTVSTYLAYFDSDGRYIATTQTPPYDPQLGFNYDFYINAMVWNLPSPSLKQLRQTHALAESSPRKRRSTWCVSKHDLLRRIFSSPDDNSGTWLPAYASGQAIEIFYHPQKGSGQAEIGQVRTDSSTCAHFSQATMTSVRHWPGRSRHARRDFLHRSKGKGTTTLRRYPAQSRQLRLLFETTRIRCAVDRGRPNGDIHEVYYKPKQGIGASKIRQANGPIDVGSFFSRMTGMAHAIVATAGGGLIRILLGLRATGISRASLAHRSISHGSQRTMPETSLQSLVQFAGIGGVSREIR